MPLATVNIETLIKQATNTYIKTSDYTTLRNSCLSPLAVHVVTERIRTELTQQLESNKQEASSQLTATACMQQRQHDAAEKQRDAYELQQDSQTIYQLITELNSITTQMNTMSLSIGLVRDEIGRTNSRIREIEHKITQETNNHHHAHSNIKKTKHRHGHGESILESQKRELSKTLSDLEHDLMMQQVTQRCMHNRQTEINSSLTDLPKKGGPRMERAFAREEREKARSGEDPALIQLSKSNLLLLQQSITQADKALQKKLNQFMLTVNETSYQTYITQLEQNLDSLENVNHHEKEALNQIIQLMHNHLKTKDMADKEKENRTTALLAKKELEKNLHQKESEVSQLENSNPELTAQNQQLSQKNQKLKTTIKERDFYRDTLLRLGLLGLVSTGMAVGGVFLAMPMVSLTPLFFAPAAVLGLVTLSIYIAWIIYTVKTIMDENQLTMANVIIENNQKIICQQSSQLNALKQNVLPSVQEQIASSTQSISSLDQRIEDLEHQAELQLSKAKAVTVNSTNNNQKFFIEPPPPPYSIEPSAPPEHEADEGSTHTFSS